MEAGQPKSAVARLLRVGRATVDRYVRQQWVTGDLCPKPIPEFIAPENVERILSAA